MEGDPELLKKAQIPKSPKTPKRNPAGGVKLPCMLPDNHERTLGSNILV